MEVLRDYAFREVRAAEAEDLFERVLAAVGEAAVKRARILLEDRPYGKSAIDRAVKRFPELGRYRLPDFPSAIGKPRRMLSNVDSHRGGEEPCGFVAKETLLALVRGVPRSYPFWQAEIFFTTGLPWQSDPTPEPPLRGAEVWNLSDEAVPHVSFRSFWWPRGYRAFVHAGVSLGDAETFGPVLPNPPSEVSECLAPFGKPRTRLLLRRTEDEQARLSKTMARLSALHEEWRNRSLREMATLHLPHELPAVGIKGQDNPLTLPHKPTLVEIFKPRGYRYSSTDSGSGYFVLNKLSPNRNRVEIRFDVGSLWRHYSGGMLVQGLHGHCYAPLPAHPCQPHLQYGIGSNQVWRQVVENVAVLVDHLERVFVPTVDALLGPTPSWYEW